MRTKSTSVSHSLLQLLHASSRECTKVQSHTVDTSSAGLETVKQIVDGKFNWNKYALRNVSSLFNDAISHEVIKRQKRWKINTEDMEGNGSSLLQDATVVFAWTYWEKTRDRLAHSQYEIRTACLPNVEVQSFIPKPICSVINNVITVIKCSTDMS
jgi:hypothetical protein